MTEEKLAEESLISYRKQPKWAGKIFMKDENTCYRDGFLAGLKAGKDMGERYKPKWHSPDEHIVKDKVVLGFIKLCNKLRYSLVQWNGEWWYQYGTFNAEVRLIKWYEIPKLEKE